MARIAIMQPYFIPYAGYFRLFMNTDVFVVHDAVQFPRGGWVHRNRLRLWSGELAWLTLPLKRQPLAAQIAETRFAADAAARLESAARRFPALARPAEQEAPLVEAINQVGASFTDYLLRLLKISCDLLEIALPEIRLSSAMRLPPTLRGVDRIYEICRRLNARTYVNAPGGAALYDPTEFARRGINLRLLPPYAAPTESILQRLHNETASDIRKEIRSNL